MIKTALKVIVIILGILSIPVLIFWGFIFYISHGTTDIETLYVQEIENSDLMMVDFNVWYGRDGNISGRTLMKSIKDFNFRKIESLPLDYIRVIKTDKIHSVKLLNSDNEIESSKGRKKNNVFNIEIITEYYHRTYNTKKCMLNEYSFDSFIETG